MNRNLLNCYPQDETDYGEEEILEEKPEKIYSTSLPYTAEPIRYQLNATVPLYYDYNFKENHIDSEPAHSYTSSDRTESGEESANETSNDVVSTDSFTFQHEELSDCEKEVESFFLDKLDPPPHSSTPKVVLKKFTSTPYKTHPHTPQVLPIFPVDSIKM